MSSGLPMQKTEPSVLPKTWINLPEAIRVRLGREAGPQRSMLEEGHLLIILHTTPAADVQKRQAALFWRLPTGEWKSSADAPGIRSITDVIQGYDAKLDELETAEDKASDAVTYHHVLEQLAPVLRASRGLHRSLQQAREYLKMERELINYRDQAAATERTAELLLQDAQFGLNFIAAKQAETQAHEAKSQAVAAHKLNMLAAFFLPLSTVASLYGMGVALPGYSTPGMFWLLCAAGLAVGVGISLSLARKS